MQHTESLFLTAGVHVLTLNHFMAPISFSECQVYKPAVFNSVGDKILHHQLKSFLGGMEGKSRNAWWTLDSRMNNVYNALLSSF